MKQLTCFVIFVAIFFSLFLFTFGQSEEMAEDVTKSCTLQLNVGKGYVSSLTDRRVESECSATDSFELILSSETPLYGIYLIWNDTPPAWTLSGEKEQVFGGENGFWHEYKALNGGMNYTLSWDGAGKLADVYLLSDGTLPDYVQVWESPCEKADLMLIPTHADDEHLWFGGTMPYYAGELGYKIQVVYLMKHVYYRHHELINGLWTVGVRNYPVIAEFIDQYCANLDQAKRYYPEDEVAKFLVENIRRFRPEVIVGHDLNGEYGHGAHILNATVLSQRALTEAGNPELYPESYEKYGIWETKKCYLHLYQENEIFINWQEKELTAFGGVSAYDMAQKGFEQHKSQVAYFSMSLDNRARYGNGLFGLYSSTVGEDLLKNDFLENIPENCLTTWIEPEPEPELENTEIKTEQNTNLKTTDSESIQTIDNAAFSGAFLVVTITTLVCVCLVVLLALILLIVKKIS